MPETLNPVPGMRRVPRRAMPVPFPTGHALRNP